MYEICGRIVVVFANRQTSLNSNDSSRVAGWKVFEIYSVPLNDSLRAFKCDKHVFHRTDFTQQTHSVTRVHQHNNNCNALMLKTHSLCAPFHTRLYVMRCLSN